MLLSNSVLTLAAVVAALPGAVTANGNLGPPPKHKEFTVAFSVSDSVGGEIYLSANVVRNQTSPKGALVIVGERMSISPGTPAYLNGTSPHASVNFDLTGSSIPKTPGVYGAIVPEIGDAYGYAGDIVPTLNKQDLNWGAYNGSLSHKLYAALNSFYVCDGTLNGKYAQILKWGTPQSPSLKPPVGCQATSLIQNFNVVGGAKPS